MISKVNQMLEMDKVHLQDVFNICSEIEIHEKSRKTKSLSKQRVKLQKRLFEAKNGIKDIDLEKIFKKSDKLISKYQKLNPNLSIKSINYQGKNYIELEETQGRGSISYLKYLYKVAKNNEEIDRQSKIELENKEKAKEKALEDMKIKENDPERMAIRAETIANRRKANKFLQDLKVQPYKDTIIAREDEIMEQYKDTPGGVAWKKMQNDPEIKAAKKTMNEMGLDEGR